MPRPREMQISIEATLYYHCTSLCVRHAFFYGYDEQTGTTSYEHRRQWVEDRIILLEDAFCVDLCAYAVISPLHKNAIGVGRRGMTRQKNDADKMYHFWRGYLWLGRKERKPPPSFTALPTVMSRHKSGYWAWVKTTGGQSVQR